MSDHQPYIDFGTYLNQPSLIQAQIPMRATLAWARILDNPTDVSFTREGVNLEPQPVRIEFDDPVSDVSSEAGQGTRRRGYIFGLFAHPQLPDLDVRNWDTFRMDDMEFTVNFVNRQLQWEIQASFEAV